MSYCIECNHNLPVTKQIDIRTRERKENLEHDSYGNVTKYRIIQEEYVHREFYTCNHCSSEIHYPQATTKKEYLSLLKGELESNAILATHGALILFAASTYGLLIWKAMSGFPALLLWVIGVLTPSAILAFSFQKLSKKWKYAVYSIPQGVKPFFLFSIFGWIAVFLLSIPFAYFGSTVHSISIVILGLSGIALSSYIAYTKVKERYQLYLLIDDELDYIFEEAQQKYEQYQQQRAQQEQSRQTSNAQQTTTYNDYIKTSLNVFGLDINSSYEDFKKAYKQFMKDNHPDRVSQIKGATQAHVEEATDRCKLANSLKSDLETHFNSSSKNKEASHNRQKSAA